MAEREIIVVGGGAAGLMAAIFAGRSGRPVTLLESQSQAGRKILISGGGRCNVLPSKLSPRQYTTASSSNTMKKILLSWPLREQRMFFEDTLGIELSLETESGKLFPSSNRSRDVRDALVELAAVEGVSIRYDVRVDSLAKEGDRWKVRAGGGSFTCDRLVLATGGLSVPKTGSDGAGLRILDTLGHLVHSLYPALTPLTTELPDHAKLSGISLTAKLTAPNEGIESAGGFLFTHRGYSGPAVLDVSHVATRRSGGGRPSILVDWSTRSAAEWEDVLTASGSRRVASVLQEVIPDRLALRLLAEADVEPGKSLAQLRKEERHRIINNLVRYPLPWSGDEGYKKAEVTGGGVSLAEVDPRTLESRLHPGLYLCGELLDAFGPIGGYNFAWAWATGRAAGMAAGQAADPLSSRDEEPLVHNEGRRLPSE